MSQNQIFNLKSLKIYKQLKIIIIISIIFSCFFLLLENLIKEQINLDMVELLKLLKTISFVLFSFSLFCFCFIHYDKEGWINTFKLTDLGKLYSKKEKQDKKKKFRKEFNSIYLNNDYSYYEKCRKYIMYLDYTYEDPQICFQKIFQSRTKKLGVEFEIDSSNINDKGLKLIFKKEKYEEEQNIIVDYILLARIIYNITRGYEKDFYYKTYFGSYIFFIGIAISLQYLLLGVLIALLGIAIIMYAILIGIGKYSDIFEYAKLTLGI